ncbi:thioredoxin-like protein [Xylogone sp. PMI_703]|nr:thioredoxin-like protein [Xylogone sp. PMI_703]
MSLTEELTTFKNNLYGQIPADFKDLLERNIVTAKKEFDSSKAIKVGETFPSFKLGDATGKQVALSDLLANGNGALIAFYRGSWCPYCNIQLHALQKHLAEYEAKGVKLVAITPELPDSTLTTTEKNELKFPVLSDVGAKLTKEIGIFWEQTEELKQMLSGNKVADWQKQYGDETYGVPVPSVFLVDKNGVVRNTYFDADWTSRLEPGTALEWVNKL